MKLNRKFNIGAICVMLTLASAQVSALTLGRMRGGALLGKELDVSVIVQFAADEDVTSTCFSADVLYGETPLERSRITVKTEPGQQPNTKLVRVTSSARIDEAVVTVNLVAACGPKASRHYVMLADVVSEPAVALPMNAPVASAAAVSAVVRKDAAVAQAAAPAVAPVAQAKIKAKRPAVAASQAASVPAAAPALKAVAAADKSERDAVAKAANQANTAALDDLQHRVDDISKWQASTNAAEELLKSQAREKELEASIKGLHIVTAKNQQNLQIVAKALENAESQHYGNFLVYALGALLAACLGAVAFVYTRVRRGDQDGSPWWSGGVARTAAAPVSPAVPVAVSAAMPLPAGLPISTPSAQVEVDLPLPDPTETVQPVTAVAEISAPLEPLDFDFMLSHQGKLDVVSEMATVQAPAPAPMPVLDATALRPDSAPSAHVTLKAINTQEMLDVRQQAEFFMALGQHDEAVKLLESSIRGSDDANPLVYLDLLKIFHTLSRRTDFERYREEFNQQFTGRVPAYANFLMEGNGLEAYDDICQQIVVLWPTDYTIDFIEQCLVRMPEDDPEQGIDLEAFKDLLLLYGVLKRLDQTLDSGLIPFKASRTASQAGHSVSAGGDLLPPIVPAVAPVPVPVAPVEGFAHSAPADLDLDLDMGLDLNLDIVEDADKKVEQDNLINFDMSGYEPPQELKLPKK